MKSEERIKQNGEVFTPRQLVDEILDKLPPEVWQPNKTFLDPSCGDGNFLVRVLDRKLDKTVTNLRDRIEIAFTALETIYGVELMPDNVELCRDRLVLEIVRDYLNNDEVFVKCYEELLDVVEHNIVCSDAFKWDFENWCPKQ